MTLRFPPTTNDLDIREKQRRLRQTRKLSQIFGELPWDDAEQPHLEGHDRPAVESASKDHPQQRQQPIRFSKRSLIDSDSRSRPFRFPLDPRSAEANKMPQLLGSLRDALGRSNSTTRRHPTHPSHISQLESARFGLGGLGRAGSTGSTGSDESARGASRLSVSENKPTRSSSLRIISRQARLKDKSRRRSVQVHNPDTGAVYPRRSTELFTPTHSQRRSVTLWRRNAKDDPANHHHSAADQGWEDDNSTDSHQPLTEAQRIQSIRRGRKLTQLFGTEPPISLYRAPALFEDEAPLSATTEESIEYLALPSSDVPCLPPIYRDDRTSMRFSHATISPISTSFASSGDPFQESENEQRPATPAATSDGDPDSAQSQDPHERSNNAATLTFRRRRLQAAKLSRFFGIAYNDLTNPMAGSDNQAEGRDIPSAEVGVKIQERGWFWGRADGGYSGRAGAQEADMNDVIALLRQMPRA